MKKIIYSILLLFQVIFSCNISCAQKITVTLFGTGVAGFNGDGYPGNVSKVNSPNDVCIDGAHNLYIVDEDNRRIRKLSTYGIITTIAGGGSSTADGVPATDAQISPNYVCIDAAGNLYFTTQSKVRRVDASTGIITTVAGGSAGGYAGDGGPATAALLSAPSGICIDAANNIYIADKNNNRVRKVTSATGVISTIAGSGAMGYSGDGGPAISAKLYWPVAICVNTSGDVYFSDHTGTYIRMINAGTNVISTIAGNGSSGASGDGGPAVDAGLGHVYGMCINEGNSIFINDISCSCREINMSTGIINRVVGSLSGEGYNGDGFNSLHTLLNYPYGVCVDETGSLYIADRSNNRIRKAIQPYSKPSFAYGRKQSIVSCQDLTTVNIDNKLSITDIDAAQSETWTVISSPLHGTLSGFPYFATSVGADSILTPSGLLYTFDPSFVGMDSFKIRVTDGGLSDTITMYADNIAVVASATISGTTEVCAGNTINMTGSIVGGSWSVTNTNATISSTGSVTGELGGTDTVIYTIAATCSPPAMYPITIDATPNAGMITGVSSLHIGDSTTLSETVPGGIWTSWNNAVATISPTGVANGISPGIDTILYYATNSCGTTQTMFLLTVLSGSSSGINTPAADGNEEVTIVPNPTSRYFTVKVSSSYCEKVTINITNMFGDKIKELQGATNSDIYATLDVPAGIYLLNTSSSHGNLCRKLVVE